jgi:hypothetical protein
LYVPHGGGAIRRVEELIVAEAAAVIRRLVLQDRETLIATGNFDRLFQAWHEHAIRWELKVDGLGEVMMHQALAGAALQLAFRAPEESTAWTLSFSTPPANVFVTGGGQHHGITGRYFDEAVKETGSNRLFVQRSHPQKHLQHSVLEIEGLDLLGIFEQFFRQSEQVPARLLETGRSEYAMVLGLPGSDPEWIDSLQVEDVARMAEAGTPLDERPLFLHCGCNPEKVAGTLARMFADQADDFFGGEPMVEGLCPRCGARHLVDRKMFDRMVEEL